MQGYEKTPFSINISLYLHSLIQAFVHCRLDYCKSALAGLAKVYLRELVCTKHGCSYMVSGVRRYEHIIPVLEDLHWLPVSQRVVFKTALIVWFMVSFQLILNNFCVPATAVSGC